MAKKSNRIKVVKVPSRKPPVNHPQVFPRIPRLYLEIIENKAKVKQDLINKEYMPSSQEMMDMPVVGNYKHDTSSHINDSHDSRADYIDYKEKYDPDIRRKDRQDRHDNSKGNKDKFESRLDLLLSDNDSDTISEKRSVVSTLSSISDLSIQEHRDDRRGDRDHDRRRNRDLDDISVSKDSVNTDNSDNSSVLSARLKELLNEDSDSDVSFNKYTRSRSGDNDQKDKYSRHRDTFGHSVSHPGAHGAPPTLAELERQGGFVPRSELRDIRQTTMSEQAEEDAKRELLFKFDILRKSYPLAHVPSHTIHADYYLMKKDYDDTLRRVTLDATVDQYKTYLMYGFAGCEFLFGSVLGFDMNGFTQQQMLSMNSYEKLLIELGEKSYVPSGSKWPVEIRLLGLIIINAAIFVIMRMMMKKTGSNLMGMINGMRATPAASTTSTSGPKRKMRGPNIDLSDIADLDD